VSIISSDVPDVWIPETPSRRTLQELQQAVSAGVCTIQVSREVWRYETTLQSIWNWMKTTARGLGIDRNYSTGTAIRTYFSCANDIQTGEQRVVIKSYSFHLDDECLLTITRVKQGQQQVTRKWHRWTLSTTFEDDVDSSTMDAVVGGLVSLFGVRAEGVVDIASGLGGTFLSISDSFGDAKNRHIFVSRDTAADETHWIDTGSPSSEIAFQENLSPLLCEIFSEIINKNEEGSITVPVNQD
jgi:hypothetical protein